MITPEEQMAEGGVWRRGEEPDPIIIDPVTDPKHRLATPALPTESEKEGAQTPPVDDPKDVLAAGKDFAPMRDTPRKPRITQRIPDPKPVDPTTSSGAPGGKKTIADFMREQGVSVPEDEDDDIQLSFDYPLGEQLLKTILANMVTSR